MTSDKQKSLTSERLREVLAYDPDTGVFTRKVRTAKRVKIGDVAGCLNGKGYIHISIDGRLHKAHRLACADLAGSDLLSELCCGELDVLFEPHGLVH